MDKLHIRVTRWFSGDMMSMDEDATPLSGPSKFVKPVCRKSWLHRGLRGETGFFQLQRKKISRKSRFHRQERCLLLVVLQQGDNHRHEFLVRAVN